VGWHGQGAASAADLLAALLRFPKIALNKCSGHRPDQAGADRIDQPREYVVLEPTVHIRGTREIMANPHTYAPSSAFRCTPTCCRTPAATILANNGTDTRTIQVYLGHKDIRHTVRYTELSPVRFKGLWKD
jgi:hypothetical protein